MTEERTDKTSMKTLHLLLYRALIDIRHEGRERKCPVSFGLADLFHTIPLELLRVASGDSDYDSILKSLMDSAKERNSEKWIANQLTSLTNVDD